MRRFLIAAAAAVIAAPAAAQQKIDFILNWVPGGDQGNVREHGECDASRAGVHVGPFRRRTAM